MLYFGRIISSKSAECSVIKTHYLPVFPGLFNSLRAIIYQVFLFDLILIPNISSFDSFLKLNTSLPSK
jgi:hypothetical protein